MAILGVFEEYDSLKTATTVNKLAGVGQTGHF